MSSIMDSPINEGPLKCTICNKENDHTSEECPKREQECPHCSFKDTHEEVFGTHTKECPQMKVPCPNEGCKEEITRISMMEHSSVCPKAIIKCQYSIIGCQKRFPREAKSRHNTEYIRQHFNLAIHEIKTLKEAPPQAAMQPGELSKVTFKIPNFTELKAQNKHWISSTFYTSIAGYKLVMVVFPNGYSEDEGSHVSCFVCLLPGEHDSVLEWPMRGEICVELLNQIEDQNHTKALFSVEEENEFFQVEEEDIENIEEDLPGVGQSNLILQSHLGFNSEHNVQYLKDDCLYFRVTIVKILNKPIERPWLITTHS